MKRLTKNGLDMAKTRLDHLAKVYADHERFQDDPFNWEKDSFILHELEYAFKAGYRYAIEHAAKECRDFRANYSSDIFPEPKPTSTRDLWSAAMGRHVCDVLEKKIRGMADEE